MLLGLVLCAAGLAWAQERLVVVSEGAKLRADRTALSESLARLALGEEVRILAAEGAWYKVETKKKLVGFVYRGHLAESGPAAVQDKAGSLFGTLEGSLILAEAADTSRATRSAVGQGYAKNELHLNRVLDLSVSEAELEDFLRKGGVGEFAARQAGQPAATQRLPALPRPPGPEGLDLASERSIGANLALEAFQRFGPPAFGNALQRYANQVGLAVARNSKRPDIPYRFAVLDCPVAASFGAPGGLVFLTTGLFKTLESEAELAGVLAHEIAHVAYRHALEAVRQSRFLHGARPRVTRESVRQPAFQTLIKDLAAVLFERGLSADAVLLADRAALEALYRTGYDPGEFLSVQKRLLALESGAPARGSWFAARPGLAARIGALQTALAAYPDRQHMAQLAERFGGYR